MYREGKGVGWLTLERSPPTGVPTAPRGVPFGSLTGGHPETGEHLAIAGSEGPKSTSNYIQGGGGGAAPDRAPSLPASARGVTPPDG